MRFDSTHKLRLQTYKEVEEAFLQKWEGRSAQPPNYGRGVSYPLGLS